MDIPKNGWFGARHHQAGWRRDKWDYAGIGTYLITFSTLARGKSILGELVIDSEGNSPQEVLAHINLSPYGKLLEEVWKNIPHFYPDVKILECQIMPDHFHGILWVQRPMEKNLGMIIRGLKAGFTKAFREATGNLTAPALFESNFHDIILKHHEAIVRARRYVLDNPRRLAVKRLAKHYFEQAYKLKVELLDRQGKGEIISGSFYALGNQFLLKKPHFYQVQVSRSDFRYEQNGMPRQIAFASSIFEMKKRELLVAVERGAVIVSPCISAGERELCIVAMEVGASVIQLKNQGFSPFFKPKGLLFDRCASGKMLLLAPSHWPFTPAKKAMTREDALVLNRVAQLICGADAAQINYHGAQLRDVNTLVTQAIH